MERFELLNEESKKMKMPKYYKEDIEADRKMLVEHKGNFLWILPIVLVIYIIICFIIAKKNKA